MFFRARLANGAPPAVGTDISTMHDVRFFKAPAEVARDAEVGSIMCSLLWSEMEMSRAAEKLGFLMPRVPMRAISSL